ncbi:hypothetical protein DYB35_010466, partial [Aphanomyces astaci]
HDRFEFPKQLNLAAYMDSTASPDSTQYHLHSILVHSGDVHGGHYYVYIRPHGQDPANTLWFKYDDDLISAVDEGDVMESSFGSPLAGVTSFSSAYMLVRTLCVYVQTGVGTVEHTIPAALAARFQAEEVAARKRKRLAQREHLFLSVRIATDDAVGRFRRITRTLDFVALPKPNKVPTHLLSCKVLKTNTLRHLYGQVAMETGVPINEMRLWKLATRENQTTRPDEPLDKHPLEATCAAVLEDDVHTKQVLLFLEIFPPHTSEYVIYYCTGVIKRFPMQTFTPPPPPVVAAPATDDESDDSLDDLAPPQLDPVAADRVPLPVSDHAILLFIKHYNPTVPVMADRLEYPESINFLDNPHATLLDSELQHGDIIVVQESITPPNNRHKNDHDHVPPPTYPSAPLYFDYLLNRVDISFYEVVLPANCSPSRAPLLCLDQGQHDDNNKVATTTLTCLLSQSYDSIVAQLAAHVAAIPDALHVRLFPSSSSGPKLDAPFLHRTSRQLTLRGMVDASQSSSHPLSLYYQVLPPSFSILDLERMVKWTLHLSPYEPRWLHASLHVHELLLDPADTVDDALVKLQAHILPPRDDDKEEDEKEKDRSVMTWHLVETRDRSTIVKIHPPDTAVASVFVSPSAPLYVDSVPPQEGNDTTWLGVVGVMHFNSSATAWIHTHSTPCLSLFFGLEHPPAPLKADQPRRRQELGIKIRSS